MNKEMEAEKKWREICGKDNGIRNKKKSMKKGWKRKKFKNCLSNKMILIKVRFLICQKMKMNNKYLYLLQHFVICLNLYMMKELSCLRLRTNRIKMILVHLHLSVINAKFQRRLLMKKTKMELFKLKLMKL